SDANRSIHSLFTDRAIYRPGQTVHAGVVSHRVDDESTSVNVSEKVKFQMYDSRGRMIADTTSVTDEFGVASCSFVIPTDVLSGSFRVSTQQGASASFSVEEYKRPTYTLELEKPSQTYASGDTLAIRGCAKSFAGVPVVDAEVSCRVYNQMSRWWSNTSRKLVDTLKFRTAADGSFIVPVVVPALSDAERGKFTRFVCTVEAEALSPMGEKSETSLVLPYGPERVKISINFPQVVFRENPLPISVSAENAAGQLLSGSVNYTLRAAEHRGGKWVGGKFAKSGSMKLSSKTIPYEILDTPPGNFMIYFTHPSDTLSADSAHFILMSTSDQYAVDSNPLIFASLYDEVTADKRPTFYVMSDTVANAVIEVFSGNRRIMQQVCKLSATVNMVELSDISKVKGSLVAVCCTQLNGKFHSRTIRLAVPLPDKHLDYEWTSFRDRLVPGQKERWTLRVTRGGKPVSASLAALMYDSSLDALRSHQFIFDTGLRRSYPSLSVNSFAPGRVYGDIAFRESSFDLHSWNYSSLMHFDTYLYGLNDAVIIGYGAKTKKVLVGSVKYTAPVVKARTAETASAVYDCVEESAPVMANSAPENVQATPVRTNFSETAFFLPALRTDDKGDVTIEFTLPESLTSWRLRGYGHTRTMDNFFLDETVEARKDFMVQTNMPRFFRVGDKASVGYTVSNLSRKSLSGKVRMEVFSIADDKVLATSSVPFTVKADGQSSGALEFVVPSVDGAVGVRVVASGTGFSDGEQRAVAILPASQVVTETLPLTVVGAGHQSFSLTGLFAANSRSAQKRSLTVEFTSNPVWLAVQALPSVVSYDDESSVSLAAAYYANALAQHIVESNPRIAEVVGQWKSAEPSLRSRLLENEELRSVLLSETPWVLDARSQTEQMNALSNLLDKSLIQKRRTEILDKLAKLQLSDGSFPWFKGMGGSLYLTRSVAEMIARISSLTGASDAKNIFDRSLPFLDKAAEREYQYIKKEKSKCVPSEFACHYMYICAVANRIQGARAERVQKFLSLVVQNPRDLTIYGKAASAIALERSGRKTEARQFVESLLEYTVATKELGRYYDTRRALASSVDFRMPTQAMAVEAVSMIAPERADEIMQMKQWIVQAKRTRSWADAFCSVNAINALLCGSSKLLDKVAPARLTIDGIDLPKAKTSDLGYSKNVLTDARIVTAPRQLTVESSNDFVAFGGVYAQYEQPMSEMKDAEGGLSLSLQWSKITLIDGKETLVPLFSADGRQIAVLRKGDKVRATLDFQSRQDMEYVQLALLRPSCAEPRSLLSGYRRFGSLWCYAVTKDASTRFFIDCMAKGSHSLSADFTLDRSGVYESGNATIQCAYATEFTAHTRSFRFEVK
ncbi:MAG: hypothetical protein IKR18_05350, partial [Bacteroidaceae bacterium]|nr:hypothetical protein [Bacteroidaceae bacterium]